MQYRMYTYLEKELFNHLQIYPKKKLEKPKKKPLINATSSVWEYWILLYMYKCFDKGKNKNT